MNDLAQVLDVLESNWEQELELLRHLAAIPSVSGQEAHCEDLTRCATAVAEALREAGLSQVEFLDIKGAPPFVIGQWQGAGASAPTLLLYAHYDVQPPGRLDCWHTPPFEPQLREDGRLYGRGVADDKAGVVLIVAALRAWFEATTRGGEKKLPCNIKVLIEGEEEIGSGHLAQLLEMEPGRFGADAVVLADTANLATGLPTLTTSLRGLVAVEVEVRTLDHPLHSGMWGGPLPDASNALVHLLARLTDASGELAIPGLDDDVPELSDTEQRTLANLPFDEQAFREDAGAVSGLRFVPGGGSVYELLWRRPAFAITALEGAPLVGAANQLTCVAGAQVQVRLAPGQDPERVAERLCTFLQTDPPFGAEVSTKCVAAVPGWLTSGEGPVFDAVRRALAAGYGCESVAIGCGGSIPFVGPVSERLGGVPALLIGVEDPLCNAHGENESLHLGDFQKAMRSFTQLFAELGGA